MKTRMACCVATLCLLSAIAIAENVYVDYNHAIDFSKFKTYAWGQGPNPNAIQDSILLQTAQNDVNSQLQVLAEELPILSGNFSVLIEGRSR